MAEAMTTAVSTIFTNAGTVLSTIAGNPLLMVFACSGVVGIAIGVVRKLIGRY